MGMRVWKDGGGCGEWLALACEQLMRLVVTFPGYTRAYIHSCSSFGPNCNSLAQRLIQFSLVQNIHSVSIAVHPLENHSVPMCHSSSTTIDSVPGVIVSFCCDPCIKRSIVAEFCIKMSRDALELRIDADPTCT